MNRIIAITGGAQGIGKAIAEAFRNLGDVTCIIDSQPGGDWFVGDIADPAALERFAAETIRRHSRIDVLVNNAPPPFIGIDSCSWQDFVRAQQIGVAAPFYLAKLFAPHFAPGASIINISSSRDRMSQHQSESYTAAKGGINALTHALAMSFAGRVRVNSISPGWIETGAAVHSGPDASQHPAGRVGVPRDIAAMAVFLASPEAGFITGENICIDGGMTRQMIYHNDHHWRLTPPT